MEACFAEIRARRNDARFSVMSIITMNDTPNVFLYEDRVIMILLALPERVAARFRHGSLVGYKEDPEIRKIRQKKEAPRMRRELEAYAQTLNSWEDFARDIGRRNQDWVSKWFGFEHNGLQTIVELLLLRRFDPTEGLCAFCKVIGEFYRNYDGALELFVDAGAQCATQPTSTVFGKIIHDYSTERQERAQERCALIKEDLVKIVWHPDRISPSWLD